jgi:predicted dinucleotide-utilizing enzyme
MAKQAKQVSMTQEQIRPFIESFSRQAVSKYDKPANIGAGHAFVAGYLQSMVTQLIAKLPLDEQLHHISVLQQSSVWNQNA